MPEPRDLGGESDSGAIPSNPARARWLVPGIVFYGVLSAIAWAWRGGVYEEPVFFASRAAASRGVDWFPDLGLGIGAGMALLGLSALATARTGWGERLADRMAEVIAGVPFSHAIALALLSGFGEELFFRGALQPRVGWFVASLLFGMMHVGPGRDFLPWTVFAIAGGGVFGGLFLATGNLAAPIAAHVLVNAVNLPILARRGRARRPVASIRPVGSSPGADESPERG